MTSVGMPGPARAAEQPPVSRRGRFRSSVLLVCAVALAGVAALVMVRLTGLDAGTFLAMPVAAFPLVAVGTVGLLLAVLALKARWLAVTAVVLVVTELILLVPRFVPRDVVIPADVPRLRIGTSNTYVGQIDARALVELVRAERLDVLAVQELTQQGVRELDEAGLRELMPYRELHPEVDSSIYSRLPLSRGGLLDRPTTWPQTTAELRVGGRAVKLVAVHTFYPAGDPQQWTVDLEALRDEAAAAGRDMVVLGDFNATLDHAPMRSLLAAGLVDTHAELGRGWAPTWPVGKAFLPPSFQIDHVLHGPGLVAVSAREHTIAGSDHRVVTAELALT
ncbi:endonuclease [Longimycelium tulufanense]|uniref:Endonuclease n=1 Tax=Longimycelium tulufanense TaxID=907463 RepID=A0A8J3CGD1_9PSEU|nr:endonuclease/exonuclease/phosphatase family protein [Longimycelium tulufanense]GGM56945.1 endonuclease [Longimycelium tulufanense]